jgi:hypothetical protein
MNELRRLYTRLASHLLPGLDHPSPTITNQATLVE